MSEEASNPGTPAVSAGSQASEPVNTEEIKQPETTTATPVVEIIKEDPKIASRLSHLTKKESELRKQEAEIKAKLSQYEQLQAQQAEFETKKAKAKENPIEVLRSLGLEFEDVVSFVTEKGGLPPPPDPIKQEIEALKASLEQEKQEREKWLKEAEQAKEAKRQIEEQALYTNYVAGLEKDLENFPLTKIYTPIDQIVEIVDRHYQETGGANGGQILTNEQVLQLIEEEWEKKLEAIKEVPKVKEKFGFLKEVVKQEEKTEPVVEKVTKPPVTLSNKGGQGVDTKSLDEMDFDEKKRLAASMFKKANKKLT